MCCTTCCCEGYRLPATPHLQAFAKRLDHTNWKERNAALEALEEIIRAAGGRITPSLGEAVPALRVRFTAPKTDGNALQEAYLLAKAV